MVKLEQLAAAFQARFGKPPTHVVRAPGRVNLLGEHVDYYDGVVLPIAIELAIHAVAGAAGGRRVTVFSEPARSAAEFDLDSIPAPSQSEWDNYVRGVAAGLIRAGLSLQGTNILVGGDLPMGAGLASSAALESAVGLALLAVSNAMLAREQLAGVCRAAEAEYAGVHCGIMDQMVCLLAKANHAFLLDCRAQTARNIPWPDDDVVVVVIDSGLRHRLPLSEYNDRVSAQSRIVAAVGQPRELTAERLESLRGRLTPTDFQWARHVVTEIDRTRAAAGALEIADWPSMGRMMDASHASLRDDYRVSSPQINDLAACIRADPGVFGARLTGAGFGGCVVALARRSAMAGITSRVEAEYESRYGVRAAVWSCLPSDGATVREVFR